MAGMGAQVIKVEKPRTGDLSRHVGPFAGETQGLERSVLYLYLNTGKKSVTLDLKTRAGRELLLELVRNSDILVENFVPGVLPGLGLGYGELRRYNPSIVMTSISNFGQTGPYRDYRASELVACALSGVLFLTGEPDREPLQLGFRVAQYTAGANALSGALSALFAREFAGEGQHIDVSIVESLIPLLLADTVKYAYAGVSSNRLGSKGGPALFRCKDGYTSVMYVATGRQRLAELTGRPELGKLPYASFEGSKIYREEINAIIQVWMDPRTKLEAFSQAQDAGVASGYVCTPEDILQSPQLIARDFFQELDHPVAGKAAYQGPPFRFSKTGTMISRAPTLGEHNREVYGELLGLTGSRLEALSAQGVI